MPKPCNSGKIISTILQYAPLWIFLVHCCNLSFQDVKAIVSTWNKDWSLRSTSVMDIKQCDFHPSFLYPSTLTRKVCSLSAASRWELMGWHVGSIFAGCLAKTSRCFFFFLRVSIPSVAPKIDLCSWWHPFFSQTSSIWHRITSWSLCWCVRKLQTCQKGDWS